MSETTTLDELLDDYTHAMRSGTAALFVGAGVSQGARYPNWSDLLKPLRIKANVPDGVTDGPLAADYVAQELGEAALQKGLLKALTVPDARPTQTHELIRALGLRNIWTTNYDSLIEDTIPGRFLLLEDSSYAQAPRVVSSTRVIKLHGSLHINENRNLDWRVPPVITRAHFEKYELDHPLLWADLTANFLTSTFLFLGFSFDDPNIEVLLRLSRGLSNKISRSPHFAIMRRQVDDAELQRVANLRIRDLHQAGIHVVLVDDFSEIDEILGDLIRRQMPPNLFVSGGQLTPAEVAECEQLGYEMARVAKNWNLVSLGSEPAVSMAIGMKRAMKANESYDPERAKFYYRASTLEAGPPRDRRQPEERVGTVIYTEKPRQLMTTEVLSRSRALLLVGGGQTAAMEALEAARNGARVVALGDRASQILSDIDYRSYRPVEDLLDLGAPGFPGNVWIRRLAERLVGILS